METEYATRWNKLGWRLVVSPLTVIIEHSDPTTQRLVKTSKLLRGDKTHLHKQKHF